MQTQATAASARTGCGEATPRPELHDTIVVGGGPAGVACAVRLHQRGRHVLLLEAVAIGCRLAAGGYAAPRLPASAGQGLARQLHAQLCDEAVPHRVGCEVAGIRQADGQGFEVRAGGETWCARSVVLATGLRPRCDGLSPSPCVGIGPDTSMQRIDVQRKRVAILGGGDQALAQAVAALRNGAQCVHIYSHGAPEARPHPMRHILRDWIHVGPYTVDPGRMTVNGHRYDVFSVQCGFEPCLPPGLVDLPQRDGQVCVDAEGAVPSVPGLYAIGDTVAPRQADLQLAFAQGVRAAKTLDARLAGSHPTLVAGSRDTEPGAWWNEPEDALSAAIA